MKFILSGIVSLIVLSAALMTADDKHDFSPGDKVEVEWAGKKVAAEVVDVNPRKTMVRVRFALNGKTLTPTLPLDKVHKNSKTATASVTTGGARIRTWTDKSGKYKVEARFVELKDGEVTLEQADGKTVSLALDKLSQADQKAAEDAARGTDENPFQPQVEAENPFAEGVQKSSAGKADERPPEKLSRASWAGVTKVAVRDPGKWLLKPDAAPGSDKTLASDPIRLTPASKTSHAGTQVGIFNNVDGLLFDRAHGTACAVIVDRSSDTGTIASLQHIDLVHGTAGEPFQYPSLMKPVDIDPAGEQMLARSDNMFAHGQPEPAVSVWKLDNQRVRLVRSWNPEEPGHHHHVSPTFARFVDADHVVTLSFPSKLVLWQVSKSRAVCKLDLSHNSVPALSANRKYLAAPVKNGVYILDALSGETLAMLPGDPGAISAMSFRSDGTQLAALAPQRLIVWNLDRGDINRDIHFASAMAGKNIDWLDNGYLLIGGHHLIDLERRIVLWRYQFDGKGVVHGYGQMGGAFWYALTSQDRKERRLFSTRLPHDEALKVAGGLNGDELLAVKPGAQVSLKLAIQGTPDEQQQATQALTAQLKQLGLNVVNASQLVLHAITETGKTSEITYRYGGLPKSEKATVTEQISRVKFVENGKVVWEMSDVRNTPFVLKIKEGETVQQALAPFQKPNLRFFADVKLPQYMARPSEAGAYGASTLSPQRIQSAPLTKPQKPGVAGK